MGRGAMFGRMGASPRTRSRVEVGFAGVATIVFVVTFLWKDWIEILFGVDPDAGSGALEWLIPSLFLGAALFLSGADE